MKISKITSLIITVFAARMFLSVLPPMEIDHGCWRAWSARMAELGPARFYSQEIFTDNPPGWLYMFWLLGEIKTTLLKDVSFWSSTFDWILKLPNNIADIATGWFIYRIVKRKVGERWGRRAFLLYVLSPVTWFNSAVFGQFDGSGTLFSFLAFYLLIFKKKVWQSAAVMALAWTVKPQAIAVIPAFGLAALMLFKPKRWLEGVAGFIGVTLLLYWPFFPNSPVAGIGYVFSQMNKLYTCTTCFTFNFWGLWGNWRDDPAKFLGLPLLIWGFILTAVSLSFIFFSRPVKIKFKLPYIYYTAALSIMAVNMFITRMHERYIFPFFAFFLTAAVLLKSRLMLAVYIFFSLFNALNVFYPYAYYNTRLKLVPELVAWLNLYFTEMSFVGLAVFFILARHFIITVKHGQKD